ncbi:MAG: porphobilinogen synthase [Gammaproteobacteria bacterium]|nr:porphobilinogen synthase [Gammaproteobacteria bacterium]
MGRLSLRRLRLSPPLRALAREVEIPPDKLIQPLFVVEKPARREPVPGLAGVHRETPATLLAQVEADLESGIDKFLLFGVPAGKRERDFDHDFTAGQLAALRGQFGQDAWIAVDVCLCSYTTHGHCGILDDDWHQVDNDASVEALAAAAAAYAAAGADCVAPSDMMDGRVAAIRAALDASGQEQTAIMSYAAKFHSAFYGPFRLAADSAPARNVPLRDRATYQIDPARPADALSSALRDAAEGADILMVKPGLPCLDVLRELSAEIPRPFAVYQTSGEQASLELLAREGLADLDRVQLETWTAMRRAGADMIISYAARRGRTLLGR